MAEETLFQKILSGEIPGNFIGKGENWGAFLEKWPALHEALLIGT